MRSKLQAPTEQDPLQEPLALSKSETFDFALQVGYLLRKTYQRHTAIFQDLCADPQLTQVQFAALCAIDTLGRAPLKEIGKAAALDPATTGTVITRLKDRGLVAAEPDASDQRKVLVALTPEGQRLLKVMIPTGKEISQTTLKNLSGPERAQFMKLLVKMSLP